MAERFDNEEAFQAYARLGPGRTYEQVARIVNSTKTAVAKVAAREKWRTRVKPIDREARALADQAAAEHVASGAVTLAKAHRAAQEATARYFTVGGRMRQVLDALFEQAKAGNTRAIKIIFERLSGRVGAPPVVAPFELGALETGEDCRAALERIAKSIAAGEISRDDGDTLHGLVANALRAIEVNETQLRLLALEERSGIGGGYGPAGD